MDSENADNKWEDKIKAKIEELKKQDLSNSKIIANMSERHFHDREKIRKYEVLQDKIKAKTFQRAVRNEVRKVLQSLSNEEE